MGKVSDNPNNRYDEGSHRWRTKGAKQGAPVGAETRDRAKAMSAAMSQLEEDHDPPVEMGEVRVRGGTASDPLDVEGWQWVGQSKYGAAVFDGVNIEGQCEGVNGQWAAHLILRDENTHVDLADYISEGNADVPAGYAHTVALVDGEVWDWSYRQIDPDGPVPLRMPVDEWESTWGTPRRQHLSRDDAEEILADDW